MAALALLGLLGQGCLAGDTFVCKNGRLCPVGTVCAEEQRLCVLEAQVEACSGHPDDAACTYADVGRAECREGICFAVACGNGILQTGELCDDGNRLAGDGCSAACDSAEECGNGIVDTELAEAEACDGPQAPDETSCSDLGRGFDRGRLSCHGDCTVDEAACRQIGWSSMAPAGWSGSLSDIWCSGREVCFMVGVVGAVEEVGAIIRVDEPQAARRWTSMPPGTDVFLRGVWGSSPDDVFAVGAVGTVLHFDGMTWSEMTSGTSADLSAVWGSDWNDVFAVGDYGTLLHHDGQSWNSEPSPTSENLHGVWGDGSGAVFAVGDGCTILRRGEEGWTAMPVDTWCASLGGVWGTGAADVFAVGDTGLIMHYDGDAWTPRYVSTSLEPLHAVWGTRSDQVFAVGGSVILSFDGWTWTPLFASELGQGSTPWDSRTLRAVVGVEGGRPDEVIAIGDAGLVLGPEDSSWSDDPPIPLTPISRLWGSDQGEVFAAGEAGEDASILWYDGLYWWPTGPSEGTPANLNGLWGSGPADLFAVGEGGAIWHLDGEGNWTTMVAPGVDERSSLQGVWGSGPADVFAVGMSGLVIHHDGELWAAMESGTQADLLDVWGSGPDDVFAVGTDGVILHHDGASWSRMPLALPGVGSEADLIVSRVWGSGPADVFAVGREGQEGRILHYDGTSWSAMATGDLGPLQAVSGTGPSDVFAVGEEIYHYDGVAWSSIRTSAEQIAETGSWGAVWATPGAVYFAGERAAIATLLRFEAW